MSPGDQRADAIEVLDPETGRFLDMSDNGCGALGYTREEILSMSVFDIDPIVERTGFAERMKTVGAAGSVSFESIHRRKDGTTFPVRVSFKLIRLDREYVVAVARDLTERRKIEAALRLSEEKFTRAFANNAAAMGITRLDDGKILEVNNTWVELHGYCRDEVVGSTIAELHIWPSPEDRERYVHALQEHGLLRGWVQEFRKKSGESFVGQLSAQIMTVGGDRVGLVTLVDITERTRAEEALDRERTLLRTVIDLLPDHIYVKDHESLFVMANRGVAKVMGVDDPEKLIGRSDKEFYPDREYAEFRGDELSVLQGIPMYDKEEPLDHPDGTRRFILTTKVPLKNASGEIIGVVGIGRDFTARKQAEADLQRSLSLLAATLESTADGLLALDIQGKVVSFNQRFVDLWRIPAEVVMSRDSNRMLAIAVEQLKDADFFLNSESELYARPEPPNANTMQLKDGRYFEYYSHPQRLEGEIVGRVWSFRDVTERHRLEGELRQVQKMESVGQLAAGIAHDFNNLLTVIEGYSDLLKKELADLPHAAECLAQIAGASERAANLTRQLLMFSRKQVVLRHLIDVNELTGNLTKMLGRILGEDIDLRLEFRPGLPAIYADPGMIEQVITNLSVNARDAMPEGGLLEISTSLAELDAARLLSNPEAQPGQFIRLSVRDTGCGIPPETMAKIFEPFFTTKEVGKGTGLGLATVYGIVMQHQGVIEVSSEGSKGTCFNIFLPTAARAEEGVTAETAPVQAQEGNETVLLVEDEALVLLLVEKILAGAGYNVLIATSAAAAQEVWREHHDEVDLLLTDMVMPGGFTGRQLAETLRKQNPNLPIIFMSGYSPELRSRDLEIREGFNFLQKPFSQSVLLRTVRRQLDHRGEEGV